MKLQIYDVKYFLIEYPQEINKVCHGCAFNTKNDDGCRLAHEYKEKITDIELDACSNSSVKGDIWKLSPITFHKPKTLKL